MPNKNPTNPGKDDAIKALAAQIFDHLLEDTLVEITMKAFQEAAKSRTPCATCGTTCSLNHGPTASTSQASGIPSGSATPKGEAASVLIECPQCKRQIASNRCAQHLAGCMNIANGSRRGARNAKAKLEGRSGSPYIDLGDDPPLAAVAAFKAKPKKKALPKDLTKEVIVNGNNKRPAAPLDVPPKKTKKQKTSHEYADLTIPHTSAPAVPSGLRESSTAPVQSPSPSQGSSPATPMSTGSSFSTAVPAKSTLPSAGGNPRTKAIKPLTSGPPRGLPGSSRGRQIAAARIFGDGDSRPPFP